MKSILSPGAAKLSVLTRCNGISATEHDILVGVNFLADSAKLVTRDRGAGCRDTIMQVSYRTHEDGRFSVTGFLCDRNKD